MWENVVFQVVRFLTVCGTNVCAWAIVTTTFMVVKSENWSDCMQCYHIHYYILIIQTKIAIIHILYQNMGGNWRLQAQSFEHWFQCSWKILVIITVLSKLVHHFFCSCVSLCNGICSRVPIIQPSVIWHSVLSNALCWNAPFYQQS
jgi:hypothetical protein